jgi:hypothetical protein
MDNNNHYEILSNIFKDYSDDNVKYLHIDKLINMIYDDYDYFVKNLHILCELHDEIYMCDMCEIYNGKLTVMDKYNDMINKIVNSSNIFCTGNFFAHINNVFHKHYSKQFTYFHDADGARTNVLYINKFLLSQSAGGFSGRAGSAPNIIKNNYDDNKIMIYLNSLDEQNMINSDLFYHDYELLIKMYFDFILENKIIARTQIYKSCCFQTQNSDTKYIAYKDFNMITVHNYFTYIYTNFTFSTSDVATFLVE